MRAVFLKDGVNVFHRDLEADTLESLVFGVYGNHPRHYRLAPLNVAMLNGGQFLHEAKGLFERVAVRVRAPSRGQSWGSPRRCRQRLRRGCWDSAA